MASMIVVVVASNAPLVLPFVEPADAATTSDNTSSKNTPFPTAQSTTERVTAAATG